MRTCVFGSHICPMTLHYCIVLLYFFVFLFSLSFPLFCFVFFCIVPGLVSGQAGSRMISNECILHKTGPPVV